MNYLIRIKHFFAFVSFAFVMFLLVSCTKGIAGEDGTENPLFKNYDNRSFGLSAKDLLSDERFPALKVEIQYMAGFKPDAAAIANLRSFLYTHLHKPEGITIELKEIEGFTDTVMTRKQVVDVERANRSIYTKEKEIAVYLLYTNTDFVDKKTLGWAYGNTSAVIYGKAITDNSNKIGKPNRTTLESTILLHEMGHLLGLLHKDAPIQTGHKDEQHESHCKNRKCLMYYGIDIEDRFGHLIKRQIPKLDKDCLEDLEAIRQGKADEQTAAK